MEKYAVVRIKKWMYGERSDVTQSCYEIFDKDFLSPETALKVKSIQSDPEFFIVIKYWE